MDTEFRNAKILVVDDQQANVDVVSDFLEMHGFENLISTTDSRKVLEIVQNQQPDLLLLDLSMPFLNGFDILEQLKLVVPQDNYLPVLVLTADVTIETKRKALLAGASDFLTKPFDFIELQARVNSHLQIRFKNEQIRHLAERQQELIAMKDKFFSIIAHDIRNPFVGIQNYIRILLKFNKSGGSEYVRELQTIYDTAHQGHELLENLLKWSRSQTGTMSVNVQIFNLHHLVAKCMGFVATSALDKMVALHNTVPEGMEIESDPDILETVIRNLLSNAVKFTPELGEVTVSAFVQGNGIALQVTDTGIGIEKEDVDRIFKIDAKLQSRKGTSGELGSGLGLILCKEFVEKLGGIISVDSEPNIGTTFTIGFAECSVSES